jgi:HAD superfamily hydrolase (TIGR01549 family)
MGTEKMVEMLETPLETLKKVMEEIRQRLADRAEEVKPVKGMEEVLKLLKHRGYRMLIVTSNRKENVEKFIKKFSLNYFIDIYPEAGLHGKEQLLSKLMGDYGVSGSDVVYIGDETRDITAGKACGCQTIAVTWGLNGKEAFEAKNPDWLVNETLEMLKIFQ